MKNDCGKVSDERCGNLTAGFLALAHLSLKVEVRDQGITEQEE